MTSNNQNNITIEPEITKLGTTINVAPDAEHRVASTPRIEDPASTGTTGIHQDLSQFLAKPFLAATFDFHVGNLMNDVLWSGDIWTILRSNPIWTNKLSGFGAMRGTASIVVQINPSTFNAGGLIVHFLPNYSNNVESHQHRTSLSAKSQQPHIKMDICTTKEIVLDIPYIAPTKYVSTMENSYDWGRVFITVMSPFTAGSAAPTSASVSVWLSFKDVELTMPIVAQSGVKSGQRGRIKAFPSKPHPSEQEKGPISKILSAVSIMSGSLSTIPTLSTIAGPVSWFTNVAAGVATSFGWSKPLNDANGGRMVVGSHFGVTNCNGTDNSQNLSLFADNKVRVMTALGGTDEDEMSINFLKSVPCYFNSFNYSTTSTGMISQGNLSPRSFTTIVTLNTVQIHRMPTIGLLGQLYTYYRGGISVRFHIYKTAMHTGRLLAAFVPGPNSVVPSIAETAGLHRAIIDISEGNEFCLTFPYTGLTDYRATDDNFGKFYIYVLNPLRGPESVSSSVQITMEVFGAPDLEFQVPQNSRVQPILAQAGGDTDDLLCETMGASGASEDIQGASQYCIGEHSTSLLQLLKRYTIYRIPTTWFVNAGVIKFDPYYTTPYISTATAITAPALGSDYLTLFQSMYNFHRGSLRFRVVSPHTVNYWQAWIEAPWRTRSWTLAAQSKYSKEQGFCSPFSQFGAGCGLSVQVPYHSRTYASLNRARSHQSTAADSCNVNLCFELNGATSNVPGNSLMYRAAADDFQLSYFIGIPDLYLDPV